MHGLRNPAIAVLFWLVWLAVLALLYTTVPPSPDQSQFDWMAFTTVQGGHYYADSFDMNWPGAMYLHEIGLRIFGVHAWTWRLTDFLLLTGFSSAGAVFLAKNQWRLAAVVFLALYPPLYITAGAWMAGQRDIIAGGCLILACALAMPGGRREALSMFFAGIVVAVAVLIRPTYLSFLAGLMFLELLPLSVPVARTCRPLGRVVWLGIGFGIVIGAVVIAALVQGNLDDWFRQSVQFSTSIYVDKPPQDWRITMQVLFLNVWHWITALALLGMVVWVWRDRFSYAVVLVLGIIATCALSFFVQNKGFGYHLGGLFIVLVLLVCVTIDQLKTWQGTFGTGWRQMAATTALVLAGLLVIAGTGKKLSQLSDGAAQIIAGQFGPTDLYGLTEKERRDIVNLIQTGSTPDQTVAVYGTNYDLPYRAQRRPTYRFFTPAADQTTPDFIHHDAWLAEIDSALISTPPAFIIMDRTALTGDPKAPKATNPDRAILSRLLVEVPSYDIAFINDTLVVYQVQDP